MKKICSKCCQEKFLIEFYKDKRGLHGRRSDCAGCNKKSVMDKYQKDPESAKERSKKWYKENPEKVSEQRKKYRPKGRDIAKKRYKNDPNFQKRLIEGSRAYRANPENKEKIKLARRQARDKNKQNPKWQIKVNLRRRMNAVLKSFTKDSSTIKLVGCTWGELRIHIESQFVDGMTWENYGRFGWHLDHIKGCGQFNLSDPEQQKKCFHYTNLQPLWWQDNLLKRDLSMEDFLSLKSQKENFQP